MPRNTRADETTTAIHRAMHVSSETSPDSEVTCTKGTATVCDAIPSQTSRYASRFSRRLITLVSVPILPLRSLFVAVQSTLPSCTSMTIKAMRIKRTGRGATAKRKATNGALQGSDQEHSSTVTLAGSTQVPSGGGFTHAKLRVGPTSPSHPVCTCV
eukprot:scaffold59234_cov78-Phaeocystis_antarctica.AAC.1